MIRKFEKKIYDKNKVLWHAFNIGELDHTDGRTGFRLACYATYNAAPAGHTDNREYIQSKGRKEKKERSKEAKKNYVRGRGCLKYIWDDCYRCAMPKIGGKNGNN